MIIVLNFVSFGEITKLIVVDEANITNPFCMEVLSHKWTDYIEMMTPKMTLYPTRSGWHSAMTKVEIGDKIKFKGLLTEEQAKFIVDTYNDLLNLYVPF